MTNMQTWFNELAQRANGALQGAEVMTLNFSGEDSEFVRFNKSEVRQAGSVQQRHLSLDLIEGPKHCGGEIGLSGDLEVDGPRVERLIKQLRDMRAFLPDDPYLLYNTEQANTEHVADAELPAGDVAIDEIRQAGQGRDLVGIYAAGDIHTGFANSLGQRNWHSSSSYNLDWSFYHQTDKAVKSSYAGFRWDPRAFSDKVERATQQLAALAHDPITIDPGEYRVYLTPAALYEIVGILSWGGFGLKSHKTRQTPLLKMIAEGKTLNAAVTLLEHTKEGVGPNFQEAGFLKPDAVTLIDGGAYRDCLVSPRSAKEYGVETNGASEHESPEAFDLAPGQLPAADVLAQLGKGVYVSNLWYLNWSDKVSCRTTGMTRFATFWVDGGEIKAPLNVMRFDETAYRMLGQNLVDLTQERELILDAGTYHRRSTVSGNLPGALVNDFAFTL